MTGNFQAIFLLVLVPVVLTDTVKVSEPCLEVDGTIDKRDTGPRCRLSGICDEVDIIRRDRCGSMEHMHRFQGMEQESPTQKLAQKPLLAEERDKRLSCTVDSSDRVKWIQEAIQWSWKGYSKCSPGEDELQPVTCSGQHWLNLSLTAVDSLDTLLIAGLTREFEEAFKFVEDHMLFHNAGDCNVFETTIRVLGGLLATYFELESPKYFAQYNDTRKKILEMAVNVGSRLYKAFDSPSGFPWSDVDLSSGSTKGSVAHSSLSEMTTLGLEFTVLSRVTNESKFEDASRHVHERLQASFLEYGGLLPQYFSPKDGKAHGSYIMIGARTDSYYEYLLKNWIMTGQNDTMLLENYVASMQAVRQRLLRRTTPQSGDQDSRGLLYVTEIMNSKTKAKMDHLVCFLPGVLALGDMYGISTSLPKPDNLSIENDHLWEGDLAIAKDLERTCYELYRLSPSGLAPEIVHFLNDESGYPGNHQEDVGGGHFFIKEADAHNLLRPETVESMYILWKVTGDPLYRDHAWQVFRAFQRWARVESIEYCTEVAWPSAGHDLSLEISSQVARKFLEDLKNGYGSKEAHELASIFVRDLLGNWRLENYLAGAQAVEEMALISAKITLRMLAKIDQTYNIDDLIAKINSSDWLGEEELCRDFGTGHGYSCLESVKDLPPKRRNKMESFWISETLKYFYLIFSEPPDRCLHPSCHKFQNGSNVARYPLEEFVLNTEAHALPIAGTHHHSRIEMASFNPQMLDPYNASIQHNELELEAVGNEYYKQEGEYPLDNPETELDRSREANGESEINVDVGHAEL
eukprot:jgi/Picsp_1/7/NSC_00007-R1_class member 1